jgi:hypothetical protein
MNKARLVGVAWTTLLVIHSSSLNAASWTEVGDAGQLPTSAQVVTGTGVLDAIYGSFVSGKADVDLYKVKVPSGSGAPVFSVSITVPVSGSGPDPELFLFDENGYGIAASWFPGTYSTHLTNGSGFILPESNFFYIAVAYALIVPYGIEDQYNSEQPIFPAWNNCGYCVIGPTGAGGDSPVVSWGGSYSGYSSQYTISMTGVEFISNVPIPSALYLFGSGLLGLIGMVKRVVAY